MITTFTSWQFESQLVITCVIGACGMLAGMLLGPATQPEKINQFRKTVEPAGVWPGVSPRVATREFVGLGVRLAGVIVAIMAILSAGTWLLL